MTVEELARKVIEVLDAQRRYFKSKSAADLVASKLAERELRAACEAVLPPPPPEPRLF